jgi:hypothetical protein
MLQKCRVALVVAAALLPLPAKADTLPARAYVGAQALGLAGVHRDIAGSQYGFALGLLLQAGIEAKRFALHAEGIPPVSLPQRASAAYGQSTPQLSLIDGAVRAAVDRHARFWVGIGMTVINQRTPLPHINQVVSSRLAGARYEVHYANTRGGTHFFEVTIGGAPKLTGSDRYTYSTAHAAVEKPERAAEEDVLMAYGIRHASSEWLIGVRSIAFSAKFEQTSEAADRNNGAGVLLEWRQYLLK